MNVLSIVLKKLTIFIKNFKKRQDFTFDSISLRYDRLLLQPSCIYIQIYTDPFWQWTRGGLSQRIRTANHFAGQVVPKRLKHMVNCERAVDIWRTTGRHEEKIHRLTKTTGENKKTRTIS